MSFHDLRHSRHFLHFRCWVSVGSRGKEMTVKAMFEHCPHFAARYNHTREKTCWYGLMSTGYSAIYTFQSKGCGINRKPKIYLRSSEIWLKNVPSTGLNISYLNSYSRYCSFSLLEPNFTLIACSNCQNYNGNCDFTTLCPLFFWWASTNQIFLQRHC